MKKTTNEKNYTEYIEEKYHLPKDAEVDLENVPFWVKNQNLRYWLTGTGIFILLIAIYFGGIFTLQILINKAISPPIYKINQKVNGYHVLVNKDGQAVYLKNIPGKVKVFTFFNSIDPKILAEKFNIPEDPLANKSELIAEQKEILEHYKNNNDVTFISLSNQNIGVIQYYLKQNPNNGWPIYSDTKNLMISFQVVPSESSLAHYVILDKNNKLIYSTTLSGSEKFRPTDYYEKIINRALGN